MIYVGQVADVESVDEGKVHLRIFDVKVALKVAGVFHGQDHFLLSQVVLAEDVEAEFLEFSVESGADFADFTFYDAAQRLGE